MEHLRAKAGGSGAHVILSHTASLRSVQAVWHLVSGIVTRFQTYRACGFPAWWKSCEISRCQSPPLSQKHGWDGVLSWLKNSGKLCECWNAASTHWLEPPSLKQLQEGNHGLWMLTLFLSLTLPKNNPPPPTHTHLTTLQWNLVISSSPCAWSSQPAF